ncbi:MAG TPA: hypothetical protein ENF42_01360 [Candidatus Bathyarchaeota archaeon]|nr:hypothetical protein [Candidatus Bathyarchaeota archaeon]
MHILPLHCKLDEVEKHVKPAEKVVHVGIGDSTVELLWSLKQHRELTLIDKDEVKLSYIAGFVKKYFPNIELYSKVSPRKPRATLNGSIKILTRLRSSLNLPPLPRGYVTGKVTVLLMDILKPVDCSLLPCESYNFAFAFGFTEILHEREDMLPVFIDNLRKLLKKGGKAVLSDIIPKGIVRDIIENSRIFRREGKYTYILHRIY